MGWVVTKKGKGLREGWESMYLNKLEKEQTIIERNRGHFQLFRMR